MRQNGLNFLCFKCFLGFEHNALLLNAFSSLEIYV
ncbi:Uncharacterised protein [Mycobacteroides abscessus subsp. abscessus]|nr:Uncharacterised protein [Mycobacteroides abscessus subsp. abscessus]